MGGDFPGNFQSGVTVKRTVIGNDGKPVTTTETLGSDSDFFGNFDNFAKRGSLTFGKDDPFANFPKKASFGSPQTNGVPKSNGMAPKLVSKGTQRPSTDKKEEPKKKAPIKSEPRKKVDDKKVEASYWGKWLGLGPSESVSARRPVSVPSGDIQTFDDIKKSLDKGQLWEDDQFPADDQSLYFSQGPPKRIEWKRPHEIVDDPEFFVGGVSRFDVQQGELGNCWFLAAVANLTLNDDIFKKVVPDQSFKKPGYCGMFKFQFWQFGHWVEIVVDDQLPTYNGQLMYMHSIDKNEMWSALLEKAYAKLHGSYEALKGGATSEAMEDFTGGLAEIFDLRDRQNLPPKLFKVILDSMERGSMLGCSIEADPRQVEAKMGNGLIKGHAYSITDARAIEACRRGQNWTVELLRIRNPWGNEAEWKGAWGDDSSEWQSIAEADKKALGLTFDDDGEFWMCFEDFIRNFTKLEICNLDPSGSDAIHEGEGAAKQWSTGHFEESWVKGSTAGGCRNYLDTFAHNPQIRITLVDPDEDDDDDLCTMIVALMQKNRRKMRDKIKGWGGDTLLSIGYTIYECNEQAFRRARRAKDVSFDEKMDKEFFMYNKSVAKSKAFSNSREVTQRFRLPPGDYVIIPSTFEPNEEGEFMMRLFTEVACDMGDVDTETKYNPVDVDDILPESENSEEEVTELFERVAGDDWEVNAWELKKVLDDSLKKDVLFTEFSIDTCKSMVACFDLSRGGKLDIDEFKPLWKSIRLWKHMFMKHDNDKSGSIDSFELGNALKDVGYYLKSQVLNALVLRYANEDGQITFDDFIGCAIKLKTMMETFYERTPERKFNPESDQNVQLNCNEWIELTMYA